VRLDNTHVQAKNKIKLLVVTNSKSSKKNIPTEINNIILEKVNGNSRNLLIDTVLSTDDAVHYPQEFLNGLSPSGFPPHKLKLKIGSQIILLRNLQSPKLCNGTRLQIAFIPRIPMIPTDLPFHFKCLQFPIKVSLATITKCLQLTNRQTFQHIGMYLCTECFSHGVFSPNCM